MADNFIIKAHDNNSATRSQYITVRAIEISPGVYVPAFMLVGADGALAEVGALNAGPASGAARTVEASDSPITLALQQFSQAVEYETVAASQTAQALGATGATGDYITGVLIIPATTTPGLVTLLDNAISIPLFVGGAGSVSTLIPFFVPLGLKSVSGAWKITTGANVSVIAVGNFT